MAIPNSQAPPGYHIGADGHTLEKNIRTADDRPALRNKPAIAPAGARGPVGKNHKPDPINHVRVMQRFLIGKGYKIGGADGKLGPLTKAAWANWSTVKKPGVFNRNHVPATTLARDKVTQTGGSGGGTPGPSGGGGGGAGSGAGKGGGSPKPPSIGNMQLIDPKSYAQSAVNAEYDPAIAELTRGQAQGEAQTGQNAVDIGGWFNQLKGTQAAGAASEKTVLAKALADLQSTGANIAGLFGGGGGDAAAVRAVNEGALTRQGLDNDTFNEHMKTVIGAQQADALLANQRRGAIQSSDAAAKILAAKTAKGSAYNKAIQDAFGIKLQQQAAIQNIQLAQQMAPVQLASAKADLAGKQASVKIEQAREERLGKQQALADQVTMAQLKQFRQQLSGGGQPKFSQMTIGDRNKLAQTISKGVIQTVLGGKRAGGKNTNHRAWGAIKGLLSPYSIKNPEVHQMALTIMRLVSKNFKPEHFK